MPSPSTNLLYATPKTSSRNPPPFASEMLIRIDDESPRYADAAGTVRQVYDGGPVRAVGDISGNGFLAALTAGTATLRTTRYARPATEYAASTFSFGVQPAIGLALNVARNWSAIWLAKPTGAGTMTALWNGTGRTQMQWQSTASIWRCASVSASFGSTTPSDSTTAPHTYGFSPYFELGGTGSDATRSYIAGAPVQTGATLTTGTDNSSIWNMPGGGGNFTGDILACYVIKRNLYPHEMVALSDHLYARFGLTNPRAAATKVVVWQGNSISVLNENPQLPELVRANLSYPVGSFFQLSQTSKSWGQMNTEGPGMTDPLLRYLKNYPIGPGDPVYVQWEGENDNNIANFNADINARIAAGGVRAPRVVVATVKSRGVSLYPNWASTNQTTQNAAISASVGTNSGAVADVATDAILGYNGTPNGMDDTTYSPDKVHLNNTSAPLAVPYFATAIGAV